MVRENKVNSANREKLSTKTLARELGYDHASVLRSVVMYRSPMGIDAISDAAILEKEEGLALSTQQAKLITALMRPKPDKYHRVIKIIGEYEPAEHRETVRRLKEVEKKLDIALKGLRELL